VLWSMPLSRLIGFSKRSPVAYWLSPTPPTTSAVEFSFPWKAARSLKRSYMDHLWRVRAIVTRQVSTP
jgi:hypothetical protein